MPSSLLDPTATPVSSRTVAPTRDSPISPCIVDVARLTAPVVTGASRHTVGSPTRSEHRASLRVVLLCVSPIAPTDRVVAAAVASVVAGNRTLVSFPVGATRRTRTALRALSDRLGRDRLVVVTGADLAADPDAELAHLVSVDGSVVSAAEGTPVPHASEAAETAALASIFSEPFPVAEWTARAAASR